MFSTNIQMLQPQKKFGCMERRENNQTNVK